MAEIGRISGMASLLARLSSMRARVEQQTARKVLVGYTASYAIYVHENREIWPPGMRLAGQPRKGKGHKGAYWDPQGKAQPKFLEEPARNLRGELGRVVKEVTVATGNIEQGLVAAGLRLLRESQELVPVDLGNLKASGFTRLE